MLPEFEVLSVQCVILISEVRCHLYRAVRRILTPLEGVWSWSKVHTFCNFVFWWLRAKKDQCEKILFLYIYEIINKKNEKWTPNQCSVWVRKVFDFKKQRVTILRFKFLWGTICCGLIHSNIQDVVGKWDWPAVEKSSNLWNYENSWREVLWISFFDACFWPILPPASFGKVNSFQVIGT